MAEPAEKTRRLNNRPRLRTIEPTEGERHASWLELFFDLVFVFAVSQVAHVLTEHPDLTGFLKYTVLFIPMWWSWVGFTFYADRFASDEYIYRILTFASMLAVATLSLTLGNAFSVQGDRVFVVCYVLVRLVLIIMYLRAAYYVPLTRAFSLQYVTGFSGAVGLWLLSLLFAPPSRYAFWVSAILLELVTPLLNARLTRFVPVDRAHIPERFGLFTIIVLGEVVIVTAEGAASVEWTAATIAAAALGFAMAACIWWINFDFVEDNAIASSSLFPRFIFLYGHFFIVASIVATGIGVEHAIKETSEAHLHFPTLALLSGGIAVYFAVITIIRLLTSVCRLVGIRLGAIAILLLMLYVGQFLPPLVVLGAILLLLSTGVWLESIYSKTKEEEKEEVSFLEPCEHFEEIKTFRPRSTNGCEECLKNNYKWVHLRLCLTCGHVGCCDSSVHTHATKHFHKEEHPIMASLEKGENWAWCYADERFVPLPKPVVGNPVAEKIE